MRSVPAMTCFGLVALVLSGCGPAITGQNTDKPTDGQDTAPEVPDIALSIEVYDFGSMHYGDRQTTAITVYNHGSALLTVDSVSVDEPFSATPANFQIQPGGSTTVTVSVQIGGYDDYTSDLTFTSDDPDSPTVTIGLHAASIADEDGDGHDVLAAGGDDCDDADAATYPGASEIWYDGVDENCDGLNDWDQDQDGYEASTHNPDGASGGGDCQDTNAEYNPGAADEPYDNRDTNCDGADDFDADGDGYRSSDYGSGTDCDDDDPTVNSEGTETLNGKDDDCNGYVDDSALAGYAPITYDAGGTRDRLGWSAAAGDLDGDGVADAVFGAPYVNAATNNAAGSGGVGVFFGGDELPSSGTNVDDAQVYFEGAGGTDLLGTAVAAVGRFNGPDDLDLAVGAPGVSSNHGAVYLFDGADLSSSTNASDAYLTIAAGSYTNLGRGISTDLDLDGDGLDELVVSFSDGTANDWAVFYGGSVDSAGAALLDGAILSTGAGSSQAWHNAPTGGDFDGDGYQDLLTGDGTSTEALSSNAGAVWAVWGGTERLVAGTVTSIATAGTVLVQGPTADAGYGTVVEVQPDWNGDHADELWIYNAGAALVCVEGGATRRSPFDPAAEAAVTYAWRSSSADVDTMSQAGDWTGDGVSDVLVTQLDDSGSYGYTEMYSSEPEMQRGTYTERDDRIANLIGSSDHGNGNVGYGVAAINRDVDGDGDADALIGDPTYQTVKGEAYVFLNSLAR